MQEAKRSKAKTTAKRPSLTRHKAAIETQFSDRKQNELNGKLKEAANRGANAEIMRLLDAGADVDAGIRDKGTTPLMWAARGGYAKTCELLIKKGANIEMMDEENNFTSLMWAAWIDSAKVCAILLAKGAKTDTISKLNQRTALDLAEFQENKETAAFLKSMEKMQESVGTESFRSFLSDFWDCVAG